MLDAAEVGAVTGELVLKLADGKELYRYSIGASIVPQSYQLVDCDNAAISKVCCGLCTDCSLFKWEQRSKLQCAA